MKKEEGFSKEAPKSRGRKTIYIKKITEDSGVQVPYLNLIMVVGIIAFIIGMGTMAYLFNVFPRRYTQEIVEGGIRACYMDKCFWWWNCTHIKYKEIDDTVVQFCNQTEG